MVWPYLEYSAHRHDLHGEENLPEDESHKEIQTRLFSQHLSHHVFMNSKYRVAMTLYHTIWSLIKFYCGGYLIVGHVPTASLLAGVIHGANWYDFIHYSYHNLDLKFPMQWMQDWYDDLKHHHLVHHFRDNTKGFGVTNFFMDKIFDTVLDFKKKEKTN